MLDGGGWSQRQASTDFRNLEILVGLKRPGFHVSCLGQGAGERRSYFEKEKKKKKKERKRKLLPASPLFPSCDAEENGQFKQHQAIIPQLSHGTDHALHEDTIPSLPPCSIFCSVVLWHLLQNAISTHHSLPSQRLIGLGISPLSYSQRRHRISNSHYPS